MKADEILEAMNRETVAAMADEVDRLYLGEAAPPATTSSARTLSLRELVELRELATCGVVEIDGVKVPPFDRVGVSPDIHRELTRAAESIPADQVGARWLPEPVPVEVDTRLPSRSMSLRRMGVPVAALIEDRDGGGWFLVML